VSSSFREVINSPQFEAELEGIEPNARHADAVLHALTWALARKPGSGFLIPGTNLSIWPVYIRSREYAVYYRYDDNQVELLSIVISDAQI
jgi:hypothetical protein